MKKRVYLAGGLRSGWQQKVKKVKGFEYIDPMRYYKKLTNLLQYGAIDLHDIRSSDIIFVYGENHNPGVGYLIEAGYAKGLGKTVIVVIEKGNEHIKDRYLAFVEKVADVVFDDLDKGIAFLKWL